MVEAVGRPAQVVFPHHMGTELARNIAVGQMVDLLVEAEPTSSKGEPSHPVYQFVSVASAEKSDGAANLKPGAITGIVTRLNYARHGKANGVVLDSGDFIHLKPKGMREMSLKVGDRVEAVGKARPMTLGGRVVEAKTVNGVRLKGKH